MPVRITTRTVSCRYVLKICFTSVIYQKKLDSFRMISQSVCVSKTDAFSSTANRGAYKMPMEGFGTGTKKEIDAFGTTAPAATTPAAPSIKPAASSTYQ